jgi:hypothetical protein
VKILQATQALKAKQRLQTRDDLVKHIEWRRSGEGCAPGPPVDATDMVGEDNTAYREAGRQYNLERVTFHLARDGTGQRKTGSTVVARRRQDQSRAPAGLLAAGLWIK